MRLQIQLVAAVIVLVVGLVLYPQPNPRVFPDKLVAVALQTKQAPTVPVSEIERRLASGCVPILEGSDSIDGADVWAVRLKIPFPKRYPWLEMWIDKKTSHVVAWKEWGRRDGRVSVLNQFPAKP